MNAVTDAAAAEFILVLTGDANRATLRLLETKADGIDIRSLRTMDGTRRLATVMLDNAPAEALAEFDAEQIRSLYDTALIALASEMSGGAQAPSPLHLEYTKMRVQFGRSIASFQAIKHRLAELHVDNQLAKVAAWKPRPPSPPAIPRRQRSLAKFTCADTYIHAARECIQMHGGVGFTWENDTHLWYRRAKSVYRKSFRQSPAFHRERMLKEMQRENEGDRHPHQRSLPAPGSRRTGTRICRWRNGGIAWPIRAGASRPGRQAISVAA
ncbi:MAG: acyl-CoA dehydrogenase family protein [Gammaproteobacteria bacterium]|nr:acyl-CoA dehydrogenase family protein [Gammaproteobacteria bacterium]